MDPLAPRVAERHLRLLQAGLSGEEIMKSFSWLMKSKDGQFASENQAKFLWHAAKDVGFHPSFLDSWAHHFHTGENSYAVVLMALDPRFGRGDVSKRRYYAYAYVVDGAGVVAAAKVKVQHPKAGDADQQPNPESIGETVFQRKEPAPEKYNGAAAERAHAEKVKGNKALIDEIQKLPAYEDQEILRSFVDQLEAGRLLSPAQLGVLRKFMPVNVGNPDEWKVMASESWALTESKLIQPALKFFEDKAKFKEHEGIDYVVKEIRDGWSSFKSRPHATPEVSSSMYINELAGVAGWKKPAGVTGYRDVLFKMNQLAKGGQKAPRSALKFVGVCQHFHSWLKSLSSSAIEHGLAKRYETWLRTSPQEKDVFSLV